MQRFTTILILLFCCAAAPAAAQQRKSRSDKQTVKFIVEKNIFGPYKPKPKTRKRSKGADPKKPGKKVDVREELRFTGTIYDNGSNLYYATVETVDGTGKLLLQAGEKVGPYKIKVILFDRMGLHHEKTKKDVEINLGDTFEGDVTGSKSTWGSRNTSRNKKPEKKLPKLSTSAREKILQRMRARAKKSRERREKMKKKKGKK